VNSVVAKKNGLYLYELAAIVIRPRSDDVNHVVGNLLFGPLSREQRVVFNDDSLDEREFVESKKSNSN
jgi:hypothetical protein